MNEYFWRANINSTSTKDKVKGPVVRFYRQVGWKEGRVREGAGLVGKRANRVG
jgi:hypothetical protein